MSIGEIIGYVLTSGAVACLMLMLFADWQAGRSEMTQKKRIACTNSEKRRASSS